MYGAYGDLAFEPQGLREAEGCLGVWFVIFSKGTILTN
jgi:hypothetical protein